MTSKKTKYTENPINKTSSPISEWSTEAELDFSQGPTVDLNKTDRADQATWKTIDKEVSALDTTTLSQRASDLASSAASSIGSAASMAYNAPGNAVKALGGNKDFISGDKKSLKRGLEIIDRKASNTGAQLGIPNLTGRSRDLTKTDPKTRAALESRFTDSTTQPLADGTYTKTIKQNSAGDAMTSVFSKFAGKEVSGTYTPAPTYINLPGRTVRSMYNKLSTLSTPEGRQAFKESVSAMFKSSGQAEPSPRLWSEFFASITPTMSLSMFNKKVSELTKTETEVKAETTEPDLDA